MQLEINKIDSLKEDTKLNGEIKVNKISNNNDFYDIFILDKNDLECYKYV